MYQILKTEEFDRWLRKLRDRRAKAKILLRIQRIEDFGNFGDCESVGMGVTELRIHYAKGYRVYLGKHQNTIVLLLYGGVKSSQQQDITKAKNLWNVYKSEITND